MGDLEGRTIGGRYRLGAESSRTPSAVTYAATQTGVFDRDVLVEVLTVDGREGREKVADLAKRLFRLRHPSSITPMDSGEIPAGRGYGGSLAAGDAEASKSRLYFVRPPLLALSLDERLSREGSKAQEALRFGLDLAECLEEAHQHGITHGKLTPKSVLLEPVSGSDMIRVVFEVGTCLQARSNPHAVADDLLGLARVLRALGVASGAPAITGVADAIARGTVSSAKEARRRIQESLTLEPPSPPKDKPSPLASETDLPTIGAVKALKPRYNTPTGAIGFDDAEVLLGEELTEQERPAFGNEATETDLPTLPPRKKPG